MIKLVDQSVAALEKALDVRSAKHAVITSNISNQDTPGYKSKNIDFKNAMADAAGTGPGLKMEKTKTNHLTSGQSGLDNATQVTLSSTNGTKRLDGNTVNAEKEMTHLAENTFMYQATAQFIAKKFRGIKNAINEGR